MIWMTLKEYAQFELEKSIDLSQFSSWTSLCNLVVQKIELIANKLLWTLCSKQHLCKHVDILCHTLWICYVKFCWYVMLHFVDNGHVMSVLWIYYVTFYVTILNARDGAGWVSVSGLLLMSLLLMSMLLMSLVCYWFTCFENVWKHGFNVVF